MLINTSLPPLLLLPPRSHQRRGHQWCLGIRTWRGAGWLVSGEKQQRSLIHWLKVKSCLDFVFNLHCCVKQFIYIHCIYIYIYMPLSTVSRILTVMNELVLQWWLKGPTHFLCRLFPLSIYSALKCRGCCCAVGKVIHSAPWRLASVRSMFLLHKANTSWWALLTLSTTSILSSWMQGYCCLHERLLYECCPSYKVLDWFVFMDIVFVKRLFSYISSSFESPPFSLQLHAQPQLNGHGLLADIWSEAPRRKHE